VGGMLVLPATPDVIRSFVAAAEAAPDELSTIANIMPAPPMPFMPAEMHGRLVIMALLAYAGEVEAGERAMGLTALLVRVCEGGIAALILLAGMAREAHEPTDERRT
jgi:Na+/proline symporter